MPKSITAPATPSTLKIMSETLVTCPVCHIPNFTARGLKAHRCKGGTRMNPETGLVETIPPLSVLAQAAAARRQASGEVEVIAPGEAVSIDLSAAARAINEAIDTVTGYEESFEEGTLEHRLLIGLEITKAKAVFGLANPGERNPTGSNQHTGEAMSRRDMASDPAAASLGLMGWLKREIPRLKRPTAEKYATAFKSLALEPATATPAQIRERVKKLRHDAGKDKQPMPTIGALYRAGKPTGPLRIEAPKERPGLKLEDAREHWHLWREAATTAVSRGILDDLDAAGLEEMKTFNLWMRDRINARLKSL